MKYQDIIKNFKEKKLHDIYFFQGEEEYFIDKLFEFVEEILDSNEKDFNYDVFYGKDADVKNIISSCRMIPLMSSKRVVIVKEAQDLKQIDDLEKYIEKPNVTTILCILHKHKKLDKRKKLGKLLEKNAVVFDSEPIKDYQLDSWVNNLCLEYKLKINPENTNLLIENIGNNLQSLDQNLKKLKVHLKDGDEITTKDIEKYVGISRQYNIFELQRAIGLKDISKTMKIVFYINKNPKDVPIQMIIPSLYGYFSKILKYHFLKSKPKNEIATELKVNPFFLTEYSVASSKYNIPKLIKIISILKEYDLKSKGIQNSSTSDEELIKEMIFKILY